MLLRENKFRIFILFCVFPLCVGSCVFDWGSFGQDPASIVSQSDVEDSVREQKGRGGRDYRSRGSYGQKYKCRDDNRCADICEDLFEDEGVVENCLDLSVSKVEGRGTRRDRGFEYILDVFDNELTYPSLTNIDGASFEALMELSVEHWVNLTDDVTESEAKALLAWIASDEDVAEVIREHGSDGNYAGFNSYEGFLRLMKEVGNRTGCGEFEDALTTQSLTGRFTFCCIAWRERNNVAVDYTISTGVHFTIPPTPPDDFVVPSTVSDIVSDINKLEDCEGGDVFKCPDNGGRNCPGKP